MAHSRFFVPYLRAFCPQEIALGRFLVQAEIYLFSDLTNLISRRNFVFLCGKRFRFFARLAISFYGAESDIFHFPIPNSTSDFQFLIPIPFPLPFPVPLPRRRRSAAGGFDSGVNVHCKRERLLALAGASARLMALTVNKSQYNARFCEKSANIAKIMFEFDIMAGDL